MDRLSNVLHVAGSETRNGYPAVLGAVDRVLYPTPLVFTPLGPHGTKSHLLGKLIDLLRSQSSITEHPDLARDMVPLELAPTLFEVTL